MTCYPPHSLNMEFIMQTYFDQLDRVRYEGPKTTNPLAFRHYNPDEMVLGKRMEEHCLLYTSDAADD